MATLQSLLTTSLAPSEEINIPNTAAQTIGLLLSGELFEQADEPTLHKFKLRVSGLLKANNTSNPITKWFGCYLAKVACETNAAILRGHGGTWANLILHLIEVPYEPTVTKEIAVEALSSIFAMTNGKQELTRDITTPRLPAFVKVLLKLVESSNNSITKYDLIENILTALNRIIKAQSTTFKPFVTRYEKLLLDLLSTSYTEPHRITDTVLQKTCEGIVLLHYATPKGNENEVWRQNINKIITEIHATAAQLSTGIVDEDVSAFPRITDETPRLAIVKTSGSDLFQLSQRLTTLLRALTVFMTTATKTDVKLPIGSVVSVIDRLYSLNKHTVQKRGVEKHIYAQFLAATSSAHIEASKFLLAFVNVLGSKILLHVEVLLHHVDVLSDTNSAAEPALLAVLLQLAGQLFKTIGTVPKASLALVSKLVQRALELVEPKLAPSSASLPDAVANPGLFVVPPSQNYVETVARFFSLVIMHAPDLALPVRSQVDQWLVLRTIKCDSAVTVRAPLEQALALSAFNPGRKSKYSVLPIAINSLPDTNVLLDSMVHPRLPPTSSTIHNLTRTAVLSAGAADATATDEEAPQTTSSVASAAITIKRKSSEEDTTSDAHADGFISSKKLKTNSTESAIAEFETPVNVGLVFEKSTTTTTTTTDSTTVVETEVKEVFTTAAASAPTFNLHKRSSNESTNIGTEAVSTADVASAAESSDDDEDLVMPGISLESSDEEDN
ncbi:hypothetical protein D0Z03_001520 [Geotrichum reessii]|nr:hypothetical protein D0Z03_001520 [Galactomyces reessii]